MNRRFYVAIEGAIAVGKTTLARLIQERFNAELMLERFEENPFLPDFYRDRERYAFQTQLFFLVSRYQQQNSAIRQTLAHHSLVSDYSFAKDRLFARLNLAGEELIMYEQVYSILSGSIPQPDLIVLLRADTDTLMQRISSRDRSFERSVSREYVDELRKAYEAFFANYSDCPVLAMDTNRMNLVSDPDDLNLVLSQVRAAIEQRAYQPALLTLSPTASDAALTSPEAGQTKPVRRRTPPMKPRPGGRRDLLLEYVQLTQEVGGLGAQLSILTTDTDDSKLASDRDLLLKQHLLACHRCLSELSALLGVDLNDF